MDDKDFQSDLEGIWSQMQPIYEKVHGYARYKFRTHWGEDKIGEKDPLPAHIFGNMWAQSWDNTLSILEPFTGVTNTTILSEVNTALKDQVSSIKMSNILYETSLFYIYIYNIIIHMCNTFRYNKTISGI